MEVILKLKQIIQQSINYKVCQSGFFSKDRQIILSYLIKRPSKLVVHI